MNVEDKAKIKEKIQSRLKELEVQIKELADQTQPISPDNAIGRISRMDAINNRSVNLAGLRAAKSKENKLKYALSRIDDPAFGSCSRCGEEIPVPRLLFMPESSRCVKCADR